MVEYPAPMLVSSAACAEGTTPPRRASLLELLHPDGGTNRSLVIGGNAPTMLLRLSHLQASEPVDFITLAPTAIECRTSGWLANAVWSLSQQLAVDGVAYVLVPPRWRLRIKHLLHAHGLSLDQSIVYFPDSASSRHLVPLSPIPTRYVLSRTLSIPPWGRRLAILGLCLPGVHKLLENVLPSVGIIARRPGARPLFDWLFRLDGEMRRPQKVIASMSWRGRKGSIVLFRFSGGSPQPSAVAKAALIPTTVINQTDEATVLTRLGGSARSAGAQVPRLLSCGRIGTYSVLLQTVVDGQSVAALLASRPDRLLNIMECVTGWLERWNRSTATIRPLAHGLLERELIAPAALLAPLLEQGEDYRNWLVMRHAMIVGTQVPLVATHNDLTMWNVLLDTQGNLGVVDWEAGREEVLPLVDFFYATTDIVAGAQGYVNRLAAFEACFAPGGIYAPAVTRLLKRLREIIQIPTEVVDLCFHACWLHHAVNEHYTSERADPRPFLQIVQWLALHRFHISSWMSN